MTQAKYRYTIPEIHKRYTSPELCGHVFDDIRNKRGGLGPHQMEVLPCMRAKAATFIVDMVEEVSTQLRTAVYVSKMFHKKLKSVLLTGEYQFLLKVCLIKFPYNDFGSTQYNVMSF